MRTPGEPHSFILHTEIWVYPEAAQAKSVHGEFSLLCDLDIKHALSQCGCEGIGCLWMLKNKK